MLVQSLPNENSDSIMEPVKDDDGIKIEISEVQISQEWETLSHLNKLVTEAKECATKALEVTQLSIIPDEIFGSIENMKKFSASLISALDSLSLSVAVLQFLLNPSPLEVKEESQVPMKKEPMEDLVGNDTEMKDTSEMKQESEPKLMNDDLPKTGVNYDDEIEMQDINDSNFQDIVSADSNNHHDSNPPELIPKKNKNVVKNEKDLDAKKLFHCTRCDFSSKKEDYYLDHISGEGKFKKCPACFSHFKQDSPMTQHFFNKHCDLIEDGLIKCWISECDFKVPKADNLYSHLNDAHNVRVLFHCSECDVSSSDPQTKLKHQLESHESTSSSDFNCSTCKFKASSKLKLQKHNEKYHKPVVCKVCGDEVESLILLKRHKQERHKEKKGKNEVCCDDCGKIVQASRINEHKEAFHSGVKLACEKCDFFTTTKMLLAQHNRKFHQNDEPKVCDKCSMKFRNRTELKEHVESVHGGHTYRCDQCTYSSPALSRLKIHIKAHHNPEGAYNCDLCDAKFKYKVSLLRHKDKHEGNLKEVKCTESGCDYSTTNKQCLEKHIDKVHKGIRWPCSQCDFVGLYASSLNRHIKIEHKGITLKCSECNFTANYESKLKRHVRRVHENVRYSCDQCNHVVCDKRSLEAHIMKEHEGVTWPCAECDYVGETRLQRNNHIRAVHKGVIFHCDICNYKSSSNFNLRRHKRMKHKIFDT
eukprot:TRINITY_DN4817_c0_g1_i7.p1 TRINITY_DN4817_c0_g1~~TRINITY_DN4817_c0_g1_i7.p1  ORF type:complete len:703 (-),score=122.26 TRINITY_DN4817_c0_g1_i7:114-2222(-)